MTAGQLISIVVPVYNEAPVMRELLERLSLTLTPLGEYEVIVVDDGSTDGSWEQLVEVAAHDRRLKLVRLSRNFGHQIAISAGLDRARGDAVVLMDADLQDPPELIPELVAKWREGYDIVYAIRETREGESRLKQLARRAGYALIRRAARIDIPDNAGDFRLLSRRAADALAQMPERVRYLRGMTSWIGFRQVGVPHRRDARFAGASKYSTQKLLRLAVDGITSFSAAPIKLVTALGLVLVLLGLGHLVYTLYVRFFTDHHPEGWTTVVVLIVLFSGAQLLSLGILGTYIARIFDEVKRRPLYVVDEVVGEDEAEQPKAIRERTGSVG